MKSNIYIQSFQSLNVNKSGSKQAPHKPILLLSIMDLIESGVIKSAFIPISDDLTRQFKRNWKVYVKRPGSYNCGVYYPFFHMSSSPFWNLVKTADSMALAPTSMKSLKRDYIGANIDKALFYMMQDPDKREELRSLLISTYLSDSYSIAAEPLLSTLTLIGMFDLLLMNA